MHLVLKVLYTGKDLYFLRAKPFRKRKESELTFKIQHWIMRSSFSGRRQQPNIYIVSQATACFSQTMKEK